MTGDVMLNVEGEHLSPIQRFGEWMGWAHKTIGWGYRARCSKQFAHELRMDIIRATAVFSTDKHEDYLALKGEDYQGQLFGIDIHLDRTLEGSQLYMEPVGG